MSRSANSTARMQCSSTVYLWYWLNWSRPRARAKSGMSRLEDGDFVQVAEEARRSAPDGSRATGNGGRPQGSARRTRRVPRRVPRVASRPPRAGSPPRYSTRSARRGGWPGPPRGGWPPGCRGAAPARAAWRSGRPGRRGNRPRGDGRRGRRELAPSLVGGGPGDELRDDVAGLVGVAEVVLHEAFDGQDSRLRLVASQLGQAELLGAVQDVVGLPGVEVQVVAEPEQELVGIARGRRGRRAPAGPARRAAAARGVRSGPGRSSGAVGGRGACRATA